MRVAVVLLILVSGCTAPSEPPDAGEDTIPGVEDPSPALPPDALDLRVAADQEARSWNPDAQLVFVSTFEGDLAEGLSGGRNSSWLSPYYDRNETIGDGRAELWSFTYAIEDAVHDAASAACSQGVHAELREGHVVTLDAAGRVVASYETRNDDEGAPITGFLPDDVWGSARAAQQAANQTPMSQWAADAVWSQTFLLSEWYASEPQWAFIFHMDGGRYFVSVDATTGEIVHQGSPPAPPC